MNRYQLREWLRYRWNAIGRHGMHSPFVYRMVDDALKPTLRRIPRFVYRNAAGRSLELQEHDRGLLRRIIHYTQVSEIQLADAGGNLTDAGLYLRDHGASGNPDPGIMRFRRLFLLQNGNEPLEPAHWPSTLRTVREELQNDDLVAIPGIFASPAHNAAWEAVCSDLPQRLSIDFFRLGLMLFREEFQIPQRFRVKFPL